MIWILEVEGFTESLVSIFFISILVSELSVNLHVHMETTLSLFISQGSKDTGVTGSDNLPGNVNSTAELWLVKDV